MYLQRFEILAILFYLCENMEVRIESGWKRELSYVFSSEQFGMLARKVREEYGGIKPVYPPASLIFAAFDNTPFDKVKVVIIGQDPYHGPHQANGLAFSVMDGIRIPPSLLNIFKEIENETGAPVPKSGNLERWARQGVLLLNSTLTVRQHEPRSHAGIGWEQFTDEAVRRLAEEREGLVFMLWGSDAIRKGRIIDRGRHLVLTSPHPSPLSASRGFFGNGHFLAANKYLESRGETPIKW